MSCVLMIVFLNVEMFLVYLNNSAMSNPVLIHFTCCSETQGSHENDG